MSPAEPHDHGAHDHGAHGPGSHDHSAHGHGTHGIDLSRLLELDGIVHVELLESAMSQIAALTGSTSAVRRVLDIGAGAGNGTLALAHRFSSAEVVAVDIADTMLARVRDRAQDAGLGERVTTMRGDVCAASTELGGSDLVWASASLHEVSDPAGAFRKLYDSLRPGGLLAILEMDAPSRVLPAARADWEERLRAAGGGSPADHPDWTDQIAAAGFESLRTTQLVQDQLMAADGPAGEYAALELRRVAHGLRGDLGDQDRRVLDALTGEGPGGVRNLGELWIRGTRTLWTARRP